MANNKGKKVSSALKAETKSGLPGRFNNKGNTPSVRKVSDKMASGLRGGAHFLPMGWEGFYAKPSGKAGEFNRPLNKCSFRTGSSSTKTAGDRADFLNKADSFRKWLSTKK